MGTINHIFEMIWLAFVASSVICNENYYSDCVTRGKNSAQCDSKCANGFFYRESCNSVNSDLYCCDEQDICGDTGLLNTEQDLECRFLPNNFSFTCCINPEDEVVVVNSTTMADIANPTQETTYIFNSSPSLVSFVSVILHLIGLTLI